MCIGIQCVLVFEILKPKTVFMLAFIKYRLTLSYKLLYIFGFENLLCYFFSQEYDLLCIIVGCFFV